MYSCGATSSRCSLCYALFCNPSHPLKSAVRYSSTNKRHVRRCPTSAFERLISSSSKFQRLWYENDYELTKNLLICDQCAHSIQQLDHIRKNIEQLHSEQNILLSKIHHNLAKRTLIIKARRPPTKNPPNFVLNHQAMPLNGGGDDDDHTEQGEEKSPIEKLTNGHEKRSLAVMSSATALVGAKRRKCNLVQKLNHDEKCAGSSLVLNSTKQSSNNTIKVQENSALAGKFLLGLAKNMSTNESSLKSLCSINSKNNHRKSNSSLSLDNGHDQSNASLNSTSKSFKSSNSILSSKASKLVPPFVDPTTGALIAIVSNPHHASLIASQHQQLIRSSSISPSSIRTVDEQELLPVKQTSHLKKFPCLLCGRDFSNKSNLNRHHSIVHVAIRSFECPRCPKKFKLRQGLKTHMQRCHGVNADEPSFVLQKHNLHNYRHHPHASSSSAIVQTNQ